MENIIRQGNGFCIWTHRIEEESKASLVLFVKSLNEWRDSDESHFLKYKETLGTLQKDSVFKVSVKSIKILEPQKHNKEVLEMID